MAPDPGLFGPDTVTWRLHADPLAGIAGLRALLLQALHPLAMAGVAQHSNFRADPWGRLFRTADYVATVTYGTTEEATAAAARVRGVHRRVSGVETERGQAYRASDPALLLWVHACLVDSFLDVGRRGGAPLDDVAADDYVAEQSVLAELVGVPLDQVPLSAAELRAYFARVRPQLRATDHARDAARFVVLPPMPVAVQVATPARPAWATLAALAFAALPGWARRELLPQLAVTDPLAQRGLAAVPDVATTGALRALRTSLLAVPERLREGPHLRAARARLAVADAA